MIWKDLFRRRQLDQDLDDEIRSHIEFEVQRRIDQGESPERARLGAMQNIRSVAYVAEATREVRAWRILEQIAQDLRYAICMLRKSPVFTTVAILSLALGIGANTTIFTLVNAVLIRRLPVSNPNELVILTSYERDQRLGNFAFPDYERIRDQSQSLSGLLAASRVLPVNVEAIGQERRTQVQIVSGNYFQVLGVPAVLGRTLTSEDDRVPTAVVSRSYWQSTFGNDPSVVGNTIMINGSPCRIVGVAARGFSGESIGQSTDVWVSLETQRAIAPGQYQARNARYVTWAYLMGRLKPGVSIERANVEIDRIVGQIHTDFGVDAEKDYLHHIVIEPGSRGTATLRSRFSSPLLLLMVVVALVLSIACANLASLLLARASARQREIATRLALGAGRIRVASQLLTESMLLAVVGGAVGLVFAVWSSRLLLSTVSEGIGAITLDVYPNLRVLLFSAAVAAFTGIAFGLGPAIQAVRVDVGPKLKRNSHTLTGGTRSERFRDALLVIQVALSMVLLVSSVLFIRTLRNLKTMDIGFEADNVLMVSLGPRPGSTLNRINLPQRLLSRVSTLPGVQSVSASVNEPLGDAGSGVNGLQIAGFLSRVDEDRRARADWVGPAYFNTLQMPLLQGREFSAADTVDSPMVAIVNQTMAKFYFGDRSVLGQRLTFNKQEYEIVGIARDAKYRDLREPTPRMLYFALQQGPTMPNSLEIRTARAPLAIAAELRDAIRDVEPGLDIRDLATLVSAIDRKLAPQYLVAGISGAFGALALLLVSLGIYGTLAYTVAQRTNEIGLRMALGARPAAIVRMILRNTVWILAGGLAVGTLMVLAAGHLLQSLLFGLQPNDAVTIVLSATFLGLVALCAGYIPSRRAARQDPVIALRFE